MSNRGAKRASMPCKKEIYDYWAERIDGLEWDRFNFGPLMDEYCCFACGSYRRIERAHIVSLDQGGSNATSNLHLLCASCHVDSECLPEELYWSWLTRMRETDPFAHDIKRWEHLYGAERIGAWLDEGRRLLDRRKARKQGEAA